MEKEVSYTGKGRDGETDLSACLRPQMATRARPVQSQEAGAAPSLPHGIQGPWPCTAVKLDPQCHSVSCPLLPGTSEDSNSTNHEKAHELAKLRRKESWGLATGSTAMSGRRLDTGQHSQGPARCVGFSSGQNGSWAMRWLDATSWGEGRGPRGHSRGIGRPAWLSHRSTSAYALCDSAFSSGHAALRNPPTPARQHVRGCASCGPYQG